MTGHAVHPDDIPTDRGQVRAADTVRTRPPYRGVTGVSTVFGTFGELLQGALPEPDSDFLVTLPIARWTAATFRGDPDSRDLRVLPAHKHKSLRLLRMIVASAGTPVGGLLTIDSLLPEGKGLASSSADLIATARAVGNALGIDMTPERIESYLDRIEPTDGVLYRSIVAYYHRRVRLRAELGSLPPMAVVAVDEGGVVDTVTFNRLPKPFTPTDLAEYAGLLDRLTSAIAARDLAEVGAVATRSALLNQRLRPKRTLDALVAAAGELGALGVVVAHSGTTLGVLLDVADPDYPDKLAAAARAGERAAGAVTVYRSLSFDRETGAGEGEPCVPNT